MQGDANVARKVVGLDNGTTAVRAAEASVRHGQAGPVAADQDQQPAGGHRGGQPAGGRPPGRPALDAARPPYVQDITETPHRTSQFAEIQNPAGLPA
jgi:hypothetical protein